MTKQEALQELMDLSIDYGTRTAEEIERLDEAVDMAIKALRADTVDRQTCDDAVSRSQAIDAVHEEFDECLVWDESGRHTADEVEQILDKLPAVQTCDDDPRADVYNLAEKIGIHRLYALVVALRGEPESCEDAVSRQAAIDALSTPHGILYPIRTVEELPSVQPQRKTGKWIVHKSGWVCSECNEFVVSAIMGYPRYNFCPMCDAKMEGAGSEDIPMEYFESGGR